MKLQGGLGNQMFQYAVARSLVKNNEAVYVDNFFLKKYTVSNSNFTARKFALDVFENTRVKETPRYHEKLFNSKSLFYKLRRRMIGSSIKYIRQQENEYVSFEGAEDYKCVYLDGYFQSEKYFKQIRKELLHEFSFPTLDEKNELIRKKITSRPNSVSIHVRRGDYLKPIFINVHGILAMEYYKQSLACLDKQFDDKTLFVFSDDIPWVRENLNHTTSDIYFIENNKEDGWKDMALMAACKHHIIANSSFSWWGAWLSNSKGKTFAPYNWFNPEKINFNIHDFIPQNWNVVQYE